METALFEGGDKERTTKGLALALAFLALSVSCPARAEAPVEKDNTWEKIFIQDNIMISRFFDGVADGLDLFLAGKRLTSRRNETSVRIDNSTYIDDGKGITNQTGVGVNLRLPNLEEYWKVKFSNYDEREGNRGVRQSYLRQTPRDTNYGATVGLFRKLGDIRTSFEPRIELQDPLKISHSITFESVAEARGLEINPKLELFATPTKGTGIFVATNVNQHLSVIHSLTYINEGEYRDKEHLFSVTNGLSLGEIWSDVSSLSYDVLFNSSNQPSYHLDGYTFSVSWSHLVYKKILDFRVTPHLDFLKINDWAGKSGLVFTVSLNF